jgi:hypothetical protein
MTKKGLIIMYRKIYFILMIIVPAIVFLINSKYFYAGIWAGVGSLILFLEKTKIGNKIRDLLF